MEQKKPPFFRITSDDHGGAAVVAALCTIIVSLAVSGIRGVVAARQRVGFRGDDGTFYVACFLGVSCSICVYRAVLVGLGRRMNSVSVEDLSAFYKLVYAAQLLGILSMSFSKVSVVMLLKRIAQSASSRFNFCLVIVIIWGTFSTFAIAFQCQLPKPWVFIPSQCSTQGYLQYVVIALNITTDVILGTAILPTIWRLNVSRNTRVTVMILFGLRLIVSLLAIGELVAVARIIKNTDQTRGNLPRLIWLMLVTHASVITATIPRTHSFWASLQTGKASTAITDQEYELSNSPFTSKASGSRQKISKFITSSLTSRSRHDATPYRSKNRSVRLDEEEIDPRTSQEPLRLVPPKSNGDLSTRIYSGAARNGVMGGVADDHTSQTSLQNATSRAEFGVWRESEIAIEVEYIDEQCRPSETIRR
ncbi:hypothetical protein BJ875DRAFT_192971 [Amylocarpus encephaloides]|uniref:Rhodopsin domain-containing protein n=1 Tax=Amylocarpus encephaloides TaxID=45428 RepID=A0A9P7Y9C2_9HELO|nr:hypothetical protein BJ875DRAFT_192971 [Amylocarpus encephaloides]